MEEWRADLDREITTMMPFANEATGAHFADRSRSGPGVYRNQGRRAASMLKDAYLSDRDLVAHRRMLPPVKLSPEGLHGVRPGTTGIPEHLYGCPIRVEYIDLPSQADVTAAWGEVMAVVDRLRAEQPECIERVARDIGYIGLAAWAVPVAEELHRQFGDLVEVRVGWLFRYPPDRQPPQPPITREVPDLLDAGETVAELDGPAVVSSGHTLRHGLLLHNLSDRELGVSTNGQLTADVVDPENGDVVGGYFGVQQRPLISFRAAPGQTVRIPLLIGTESSTLRLGYAVPPGHWGLQVTLALVHPVGGSHRRTPILPLTITA
jgi:hypothetical protein